MLHWQNLGIFISKESTRFASKVIPSLEEEKISTISSIFKQFKIDWLALFLLIISALFLCRSLRVKFLKI